MVNIKLLQDYIKLEEDELEQLYSESDIDRLLEDLSSLKFDSSHILLEHTDAFSNETVNPETLSEEISRELDDRGFTPRYIKAYLEKAKEKDKDSVYINLIKNSLIGNPENNVAPNVQYRNKNIKLKDLKESFKEENLTFSNFTEERQAQMISEIELILQGTNKYKKGLDSILSAIKNYQPPSYSRLTKPMSSVSRVDPSKKEEREELYEFYEELYPLYDEIKTVIKNILDSWDRVDDDLLDNLTPQSKPNPSLEFIEELDGELEELFEVYKLMKESDYNYILRTNKIKYDTDNINISASGKALSNLAIETISDILRKPSGKKIQIETPGESSYADPTHRQKVLDAFSDTDMNEDNEASEELTNVMDELDMDSLTALQNVDPMFIIASEKKLIKKKYSITSWQYIKDEIESVLSEIGESDLKSVYEFISEQHDEYQEQAYDEDDERNSFYIPLNDDAVRILSKHGFDIDYDKLEEVHQKLISVIAKILEVPTSPSKLPSFTTIDDYAPGATEEKGKKIIPAGKGQEVQRQAILQNFNLKEGRSLGKIGDRREKAELGKFADSFAELIELTDRYYGNPVRQLMIPYVSIPTFLSKQFLSPIINHGGENLGRFTFGLYRDWAVAILTPAQLDAMVDYMQYMNQTVKDAETLESKAQRLLKVLKDINPDNAENDLAWVASELKKVAKRNSTLDLSDLELFGRPISSISYNKKKQETSYYQLQWLIYEFRDEIRNRNNKEQLDKFIQLYTKEREIKLASYNYLILDAHDEIRKMLGKPIYYNTGHLDSFENMSDTIDLIKDSHGVDLTSHDIIKMVEDFDSYESLAKKMGTTAEVVYHVKALYR